MEFARMQGFFTVCSFVGFILAILVAIGTNLPTIYNKSGIKISFLNDAAITLRFVGWTVGDVRDIFIDFDRWEINEFTACTVNGDLIKLREMYIYELREGDHLHFTNVQGKPEVIAWLMKPNPPMTTMIK